MNAFLNPLDRWNERFSNETYLFGEEPNLFLKSQAKFLNNGSALSIADGEGRNSIWLAEQGLSVDAFDFSPPAIKKAENLAIKRKVNVNYQCSDWQSFDWKNDHYDNVVGIFFQFVEPDGRKKLFANMAKALRPGGILIILGYGLKQMEYKTGGPGIVNHLYDELILKESFSEFKILNSSTYQEITNEGSGHSGMSALVGFVARKPS
tara:strand:+ start:138 stop:758 length:621 start_codon:yes stop_codon:yes gene_type:complete